jgi:hypothetical protein
MGTRHLTIVIVNQETKVAQYGQWDGYPEGQGTDVLAFLKSMNKEWFIEKLKKCKWADEKETTAFLASIGVNDGWMNGVQASKYHGRYPYFNRDHGAKILKLIYESKDKEVLIQDSSDFAGNSLSCEWAYVIDFDKNVLEVYSGFNTEPLSESDRFFNTKTDGDKYKPIRIRKSYDLNNLPEEDEFLADFIAKEEEEEA